MKWKKLLSLALAGVMTLALLTSCGGKSDDTLRAEALADLINVREGVNITCKADPQLNEVAQRLAETKEITIDGFTYSCSLDDLNYSHFGHWYGTMLALLNILGFDSDADDKQVMLYHGVDRGSDDPVRQAIDLCDMYREMLPIRGYTPNFLASSYRVGFGSWTDKDNIPHLFVIMVGDIPARS